MEDYLSVIEIYRCEHFSQMRDREIKYVSAKYV